MKRFRGILTAITMSAGLLPLCLWASAEEPPLVWTSTYTASAPRIDGQVDEVWAIAEPLTVTISEALGSGDPV